MSLDRLKESFVAMVEAALDVIDKRRVDYAALYPAKVIQQASDGTLEVRPDDARLGESLTKVPIRTPAPDIVVTVQAGAYVLIGFEGKSPSAPYASLWQSGAVVSVAIGGNTDAAALASKVEALETAFNSHTHPFVATGASSPTSAPTAPSNNAPYGSTKLLLGG